MRKMFSGRRALSPLVATILLVVFSLVVGVITMNWGKSYVAKIAEEPVEEHGGTVVLDMNDVDTPLKELQLMHLTGKITQAQYLEQEKSIISG